MAEGSGRIAEGETLADEGGRPWAEELARTQPESRLRASLAGDRLGRFTLLEGADGGVAAGVGRRDVAYDERRARQIFLIRLGDNTTDSGTSGPSRREPRLRAARALARLAEPHVATLYEAGVSNAEVYLALERVEGPTLRSWLAAADGPQADTLAILRIFAAVARGLAAAHRLGIVHGEFDLDAVIIQEGARPRVIGFEAAVARAGSSSAFLDARRDQVDLCAAVVTALNGHPPRAADDLGERGRSLPGPLRAALLRGLDPDPARRWPTLEPICAALDATLSQLQPGLFTNPRHFAFVFAPLFFCLPLLWWLLERAAVVPESTGAWLAVSAGQVLVMLTATTAVGKRVNSLFGAPQLLRMPVVLALFLLGHRAIALASGLDELEIVFAYDYLAIAGMGVAMTVLVERALWPAPLVALTLAIVTTWTPAWGPRSWICFSLLTPLLVLASLAASGQRLRRATSQSPKRARAAR